MQVRKRLEKAAGPACNVTVPGALYPDGFGQAFAERQFLHEKGAPRVSPAAGHDALGNKPHDGRVVETRQNRRLVANPLMLLAPVGCRDLHGDVVTALQVNGTKNFGSRPAAQAFPQLVLPGNWTTAPSVSRLKRHRQRRIPRDTHAKTACFPCGAEVPARVHRIKSTRLSGTDAPMRGLRGETSVKVTNTLTTPSGSSFRNNRKLTYN
ncbi:hypothetical protein GCM10007170_20510 [Arthrobacter liuii]|uniref:Uncharacterized protein n=1 Tax=Arthrobacter liuii TaxID=1476996 RepID=A0ABQ2ATQ0_9MICC|nr:hypothetical protein GCM10007170_20510 [Arthrobacter liuii]